MKLWLFFNLSIIVCIKSLVVLLKAIAVTLGENLFCEELQKMFKGKLNSNNTSNNTVFSLSRQWAIVLTQLFYTKRKVERHYTSVRNPCQGHNTFLIILLAVYYLNILLKLVIHGRIIWNHAPQLYSCLLLLFMFQTKVKSINNMVPT